LANNERLMPLPDDEELTRRNRRFDHQRRFTGALLGMVMGAVYVMVAQSVNSIALPGMRLYSPPPGFPWSAFIGAGIGLLVGLSTSWPRHTLMGILLGSFAGALMITAFTLYQTAGLNIALTGVFAILLVIFLPIAVLVSVVIIIFRWALDRHQVAMHDQGSLLLRVGIPVVLIALVAGLAWTQQYPPYARNVLHRMDSLVQKGLAAQRAENLPPEFVDVKVGDFIANAQGTYTLQWEHDSNNRFRIARPANTEGRESLAIARFENGWILVCLYPRPEWNPRCRGLWPSQMP
jgi:hypothetical protein